MKTYKHSSLPETLLAMKQLTWNKAAALIPWLHELEEAAKTQAAGPSWRERLWQAAAWLMIGGFVLVLYVFIVVLPSL
jgi:hypothetical protein